MTISANRKVKVGIITLGCDKNTVDSERYLAQLSDYSAEYTPQLVDAEIIIVNTCGFIDAAKKESIDAMLEAARFKTDGCCQAVVAVGCMIERHKEELVDALPEVDLFLGSSEMQTLVPQLTERGLLGEPTEALHPGVRLYTGDLPHVRYMKISEGCDHGCAFCAIPLMRGKHRSFALDEVVREAQLLELQGARELNLVAQDLAHYGRDRNDGIKLPDLLQAFVAETSIPWIRMLYLYSAGITDRLLDVVAREDRVLPYLDMPIQHGSDLVLARMRRPERKRTIRERVKKFRDAVPDVAILRAPVRTAGGEVNHRGESPGRCPILAVEIDLARRIGCILEGDAARLISELVGRLAEQVRQARSEGRRLVAPMITDSRDRRIDGEITRLNPSEL